MYKTDTSSFTKFYDYGAALQKLKETVGVSCDTKLDIEPQTGVFQILGATYRARSDVEGYTLIRRILSPFDGEHVTEGFEHATAPLEHPPFFHDADGQRVEANSHMNSVSGNPLHQYTSILFEKGQELGETPKREVRTLSLDPPQFKVSIRFGHIKGLGIGRTKKLAGHLAAKEVCHKMRVCV